MGDIANIKGSKEPILWKSMRILLDSWGAATLINKSIVKTLKPIQKREQSGPQKLIIYRKCEITFIFPALRKYKQWNCYVVTT
jgi:hypothetical protein